MTPHGTHPDRPGVVDLRSDTFTQPTDAMRRAMAEAEVGDDLFDEDPTVQRLEANAARVLGKEAAMFVPTGTMGNLIAVLAHTRGPAEIITEARSHIIHYESGSLAAVAGCQVRPIVTTGGVFTPAELRAARRPDAFVHPRQGLVTIENTLQGWNGRCWAPDATDAVAEAAQDAGLPLHCDGARIFNAAVAQRVPAARLVAGCDTVMFCFSKGLSAPVGSMLVGPRDLIEGPAVRARKMVGGAMRQSGVVAAACQVGLDTMVDRLADDHRRARRLAEGLHDAGWNVDPDDCPTNIVYAVPPRGTPEAACAALRAHGVLALPGSATEVRFVTHRHVDDAKTEQAVDALARLP